MSETTCCEREEVRGREFESISEATSERAGERTSERGVLVMSEGGERMCERDKSTAHR